MTRIFTAFIICIFASKAASAQVTDPAKRKELSSLFFQSCVENAETKPDDEIYVYMKKYCECSTERVMNAFTESQFAEMNDWSEEEMTEALLPVVKDCMTKLEEELRKVHKTSEK